jgi:hypothetical protein
MMTAKPCTALYTLNGVAILVTSYSDTGTLRMTDASGRCFRDGRWPGYGPLMTILRMAWRQQAGGDNAVLPDA